MKNETEKKCHTFHQLPANLTFFIVETWPILIEQAVKLSTIRYAPGTQFGSNNYGTDAPPLFPLPFATLSKTVSEGSAADLLYPTHPFRPYGHHLQGIR